MPTPVGISAGVGHVPGRHPERSEGSRAVLRALTRRRIERRAI